MLGMQYTRKALDHWKQWCPEMYRELQKSGQLNRRAQLASREAAEKVGQLVRQGLSKHEAEEFVLPELINLPPEQAVLDRINRE